MTHQKFGRTAVVKYMAHLKRRRSWFWPREAAWHFSEEVGGYSNGDTFYTKSLIDNESKLQDAARKLVERGATPQQLRDWATRRVIGPYNKEQLKNAQEWNAIPLEERNRMKEERDREQLGDAYDFATGLWKGTQEAMGAEPDEGQEIESAEDELIDPELVNWDELHQDLLDELDEGRRFEERQRQNEQVAQEQGLGWVNNGGDAKDKMRDAFYRYHGALPEEEIQSELGPGYHGDDERNDFKRNVNIPFEHMEQLSGWPGHYDVGRNIFDHRFPIAEQKAREELLARGLAPEKVEEVLNETGAFRPDYVKQHFPGGRYDTPINMEDPEERRVFLSDPKVQEIQQNGYDMHLHDLYNDLSHSISYGQPHPYTQQMAQALSQRGYTPEQIQQMMAPQWRWDEELKQRFPANPSPPPVEQWQDTSMDEPGSMTIPENWS